MECTGWVDHSATNSGGGAILGGSDCDDWDNRAYPDATNLEVCDGADNDCSGLGLTRTDVFPGPASPHLAFLGGDVFGWRWHPGPEDTLLAFAARLTTATDGTVDFALYRREEAIDAFVPIASRAVSVPSGTGWRSSGPLTVDTETGIDYAMVVSCQVACTLTSGGSSASDWIASGKGDSFMRVFDGVMGGLLTDNGPPSPDEGGLFRVIMSGEIDFDSDGSPRCEDCDDREHDAYPLNAEDCSDGIDNNCDGDIDVDNDRDSDGYSTCTGGDCDDLNGSVHPTAAEACDRVDNDCDGLIDEDFDTDEDGWGDGELAACSSGVAPAYYDCDSDDPREFPGQIWYVDEDGDGYGVDTTTTQSCQAPAGYGVYGGDCADYSAGMFPQAFPDSSALGAADNSDSDCDGADTYTTYGSSIPRVTYNLGASAEFGTAMAMGDLDGDLFDDLFIGAPQASGNGAVILHRGLDAWDHMLRQVSRTYGRLVSSSANAEFGATVAVLHHPGGAGNSDLLVVGAPGFNSGNGAVYVFDTADLRSGGVLDPDTMHTIALIQGRSGQRLGASMHVVDDMDGDSRAELLVGEDGAGTDIAYLFLGHSLTGALDDGDADYFLRDSYGLGTSSFGAALTSGDFDADGVPDLVIGDPAAVAGLGSVYVVAGRDVLNESSPHTFAVGGAMGGVEYTRLDGWGSALDFGSSLAIAGPPSPRPPT